MLLHVEYHIIEAIYTIYTMLMMRFMPQQHGYHSGQGAALLIGWYERLLMGRCICFFNLQNGGICFFFPSLEKNDIITLYSVK